jgi:phage terminase large subunit GpA-like protein
MNSQTAEAVTLKKMPFPVTEEQKANWGSFLLGLAAQIPTKRPCMSIAEHAESNRVMPPGERYPGPLRLDRAPYLREIMDNMSPNSEVRQTIVMKGAQTGVTMAMECICNYYIGEFPADQLLVTASAENYRRWVSRRLEPSIDSYGYRDKLFAQGKRKSGQNSGDKSASKEYVGGQLDLVSALSAASLRALTKRVLQIDEADGAKEQLDTGEGSYIDVVLARVKTWGYLARILMNSTPTLKGQSIIERHFKEGDQRLYNVPCPSCERHQVMTWPGFKWKLEDGLLKAVWYECEYCEKPIYEYQKRTFMPNGYWKPTAKPKKHLTRSYHIPSWYAPLGFSPWMDIVDTYLRAQGNANKLRSFVNLEMGLPFEDKGARPSLDKVILLRGDYQAGTVPDGVLFLTAAVDVQRGSLNDPNNPPRLEMEVCGHGIGWRTWSIVYKRFEGAIDDPYSGAWAKLRAYGMETELTFKRADGMKFPVKMMFVDSQDGVYSNTVYRFTSGLKDCYPISGFKRLKKRKTESEDEQTIDEVTTSNLKRFRVVKSGDVLIVQISTNHYKINLYNNLNVQRLDQHDRSFKGVQRPGFCDFPAEYGEDYFKMLTAEDRMKDDSFKSHGRRNESLDCRVYNLCAADFFLQMWTDKLREQYKNDYKPEELRYRVDIFYTLEFFAKLAGVDYDRYAGTANRFRKAV